MSPFKISSFGRIADRSIGVFLVSLGAIGVIVIAVIVIVEGASQLANSQIQVGALVFNRITGVVLGLITAIMLSVLVTYELEAASNPFGGGALDSQQLQLRDAVKGSHVAVPLVSALGKPIITIFQLALPADPQIYFSNNPVT